MNKYRHITICLSLVVWTLMSGVLMPSEALCRLTGGVDLKYVDLDYRDDVKHKSSNSLTQHYSLLYDSSAALMNGRLGKYSVALGYEWLAFDSKIESTIAPSENISGARGHLFYRGELIVDPKEIPFRLTLFSRDMNKSAFVSDSSSLSRSNVGNIASYIDVPSDIILGINNGLHISTGATLVMGVKNGMTNGYNEVLRHFPMLLLDYRDMINQDRKSMYPVDNRFTRLAFVSLNKKDNWFHYRYSTYNDYVNMDNNYYESQFQLGTVDQNLARRWVDFTNWMRVSVDGQLTKRIQARQNENFEEISLNLFGNARRQTWEIRTFNNFTRRNELNVNRLTYTTSLPVYANGIISPTAAWSAFAKYNDTHTDKGAFFNTTGGGYTIDSFRKSPFTLRQELAVEKTTSSGSAEAIMIYGKLGTTSTPLYSRALSLKALYSFRYNRYNDTANDFTLLDQDLNLTADYSVSNTLRVSATQIGRVTEGATKRIDNVLPGGTETSSQYISPRENNIDASSSGFQSISSLSFLWIPRPRLNAGLSISENMYFPASGVQSNVTRVDARVDYSDNKLKLFSNTSYVTSSSNGTENLSQLTSTNTASYVFSRSLNAKVGFTYFKMFGGDQPINIFNAEEAINYTFYQDGGTRRKLFEINQSLSSVDEVVYTAGSSGKVDGINRRASTLLIGAKCYPLRNLTIAGGARYLLVNGLENDVASYYGSLSLKFKLMEAGIDYNYDTNRKDNRVEKKIMANVKKRF